MPKRKRDKDEEKDICILHVASLSNTGSFTPLKQDTAGQKLQQLLSIRDRQLKKVQNSKIDTPPLKKIVNTFEPSYFELVCFELSSFPSVMPYFLSHLTLLFRTRLFRIPLHFRSNLCFSWTRFYTFILKINY